MEEQPTSTGDQSDRPPAPNTKAGRARLWRARRKNDLSAEQLEDARKKNRDRQKRFRDRKREQKREARGLFPFSAQLAGAVPDLFSLTFSGELAAGHSVLAAACSSAMRGMPQQEIPTVSAAPPAAEPGSSTQDAAPASNGPADFAAGLQADNGVLPHAALAQASKAAFDSSHKVVEVPFQEPRSRDGQAAALSRPEELGSPAVEKFLRDLNSHGVNLGSKCLESFSNISDTAQSVLLRSLMARLREGLEDQVWTFALMAVMQEGQQPAITSESPGEAEA